MKLVNLLEAPARLHVNGKLTVLADLIVKDFGNELYKIPFTNRCLIGQFAYLLSARTSASVKDCVEMLCSGINKLRARDHHARRF